MTTKRVVGPGADSKAIRLEACLPLKVRPVPEREAERRHIAVSTPPLIARDRLPRLEHEVRSLDELAAQIRALDQKLDVVISLLAREQRAEAESESRYCVLRCDGLAYRSPAPYGIGTLIEVELTLSLVPLVEVSGLAEVIACAPDDGADEAEDGADPHYWVDLRFRSITDAQADDLYRYIFTVQRRQRRTGQAPQPAEES